MQSFVFCYFFFFIYIKQLKDGTATPPVRPTEQEGCFLVRDDLKPKTKQKTLEVKTNILSRSLEGKVMFFMHRTWSAKITKLVSQSGCLENLRYFWI